MRVLALTSLYPGPFRPGLAVFNQRQIRALGGLCEVSLVAPIPFTQAWPRPWCRTVPPPEDFPVLRPWFFYLPGLQRGWQGRAYLRSVWPSLARLARRQHPQVLYATWLYPDAWAGLMAARRLGLPLAVRLHGSDLLVQGRDPQRRPFLRQTLACARAVAVPSQALAQAAADLGARPERLHVVPGGLDHDLFRPEERAQARRELGLPAGPLALFVGRLEQVKGPQVLLEALARLPDLTLAVVGQGSLEAGLRRRAEALGLTRRIIWAGPQPSALVARYLAAADVLALPSLSEGEPNVVLEALAAGRPVAASAVGGVPALVQEGVQGSLAAPGDSQALAQALSAVLARPWDPYALAARVAERSWEASARGLRDVLQAALDLGCGA